MSYYNFRDPILYIAGGLAGLAILAGAAKEIININENNPDTVQMVEVYSGKELALRLKARDDLDALELEKRFSRPGIEIKFNPEIPSD